jgi:hypothetical protein
MSSTTKPAVSAICLKKVSELLKDSSGKPAIYHVADYQRGYRWTPQQVMQLLDDLWEFVQRTGSDPDAFYCLQPLVIKPDEKHGEVVDGQQRLTTILLILSYFNQRLEEERQPLYSITFETRKGFDQFLAAPSEQAANSNVDFFHLFHAMSAIKEWFKNRRNYARDIESALLNRTKVIWFELPDSDDPVAAFTRLNAGKIPLTNDELIRALFLRRGAVTALEAEATQLRIANEWDQIEKELQRDSFWCFLTNETNTATNRIRFIFRELAKADGVDLDAQVDPYAVFYHFNRRLASGANPEKEWLRVKEEFMRVQEWFEDRILFHLVGYLVHRRVPISELRELASNLSKKRFDQALRRRIFAVTISSTVPDPLTRELVRPLVEKRLADLSYESSSDRSHILGILLLFNIATLVQSPRSNIRFQFDSFKRQEWNIEHVRSIASEPPSAHSERRDWLVLCLDHLDLAKADAAALRDEIEAYLLQPRPSSFDAEFPNLHRKVLDHFGESEDTDAAHGISNLALLDAGTNKSYKNAPFAVKRRRVLNLDKAGTFVPLCTRNVFLKCYSPTVENVMFWAPGDQEAYQDSILDTLVDFFTNKTEGSA